MIAVLAAAAATALASFTLTRAVIGFARTRLVDHPNERSSHAAPTPRGGGIAIVVAFLSAWAAWLALAPDGLAPSYGDSAPILMLTAAVAALSLLDDWRSLPVWLRFGAQGAAVAIGLSFLPETSLVFQGLVPFWLDRAGAFLAWLWFLNLFNFMDGIDGLAGVETLVIGAGLFALALLGGVPVTIGVVALAAAAAAAGFLPWNWQPAKIFMGDVGSVGLGFALGWLLIAAAAAGTWQAAVILPLYYWIDASWTLLRRGARGEKFWRAHRDHLYQRAVQRGYSHAAVSGRVAVAGTVLIGFAVVSLYDTIGLAVLAAALTVGALLSELARGPKPPPAGKD